MKQSAVRCLIRAQPFSASQASQDDEGQQLLRKPQDLEQLSDGIDSVSLEASRIGSFAL
jgi:hypothetical protein